MLSGRYTGIPVFQQDGCREDATSELMCHSYAEQPKYRCPRCKSQTCSLPCYKKHQQRSACNGVRDPAAFVKKSQWATANGIDHDYNYLKSVERQIERATDETKSRTLPEGQNRKHATQRPEGPLQRYLAEHNIGLIRAPSGMSRSQSNKTRVTGGGKVVWTIEWIAPNDQVYISDDNSAVCKIGELHAWAKSKQAKAARTRLTPANNVQERQPKRQKIEELEVVDDSDATLQGDSSSTSAAEDHYYLRMAGTASDATVLYPIDAEASLTSALTNRSVQEFPTILVLPYSADNLPSQYTTEESYLASRKAGENGDTKIVEAAVARNKPLDAEQVLEMLRRDTHDV